MNKWGEKVMGLTRERLGVHHRTSISLKNKIQNLELSANTVAEALAFQFLFHGCRFSASDFSNQKNTAPRRDTLYQIHLIPSD